MSPLRREDTRKQHGIEGNDEREPERATKRGRIRCSDGQSLTNSQRRREREDGIEKARNRDRETETDRYR